MVTGISLQLLKNWPNPCNDSLRIMKTTPKGDAMKEHNANRKNKETANFAFPCDLPKVGDLSKSRNAENCKCGISHADGAKLDFPAFESWLECQLRELESRFERNITVNSLRTDLKKSR